jgi:hypothetical protein
MVSAGGGGRERDADTSIHSNENKKKIKLFFDDLKYGWFSFLGPIYVFAPLGYRLLDGLCSPAPTW